MVVGLDSITKQLVLFDNSARAEVRLPLELAIERPSIEFSTSYLDCHIDVCSPELMLQFSDNFDYQVMVTVDDIL